LIQIQNRLTGFQKAIMKCYNQPVEKTFYPVELVRQLFNQGKNNFKTFKQAK